MNDIERFLEEDISLKGDITSDSLFSDETAKANIFSREKCIIAGVDEIKKVFDETGAKVFFSVKNGDKIEKNKIVAKLKGPIRSILLGERLALNILGRMSGVATETKKLVDLCKPLNPNIRIAATRKTTPGFRYYEKKAVEIGGGDPHRFGLFDAVMIKDNHLKKFNSVESAIKKVKSKIKNKIIEIEVENEKDAIASAKEGVDVIMLDNMRPEMAKVIASKIKNINPNIMIEIYGGITEENIKDYADFADRISLGYITNSIKTIDFSLEIE
jgi:nicotinate-nucleotide pyrophosphorylase (carboxylating)